MKVTYIDHKGSDLSVVNAARVSFAQKHEEFDGDADSRLINYLARNNHWTPFGHTSVTLHVKAPIFVARQLGKHQVGFVWNEVSRRYVTDKPEFYMPEVWRNAAYNVKQGSADTPNKYWNRGAGTGYVDRVVDAYEDAYGLYQEMMYDGVCPEQARMVLPQSMYTEWYWTGSIAAFCRVYKLRIDPHSQRETQEIAKQIGDVIAPLFPVSWEALIV